MESEPSSALGGWLRHHHHPLLRALRLLIRSLPTLVAVLAVLATYLAWLGFPPPLVRKLLHRIEESQGVALQIDRITLHPLRGLTARNLRYFGRDDRPVPILDAERVSLIMRPRDLLRRHPVARGLHVQNGTIRIDPPSSGFGPSTRSPLLLSNVSARVLLASEHEIEISEVRATLRNLLLRGRGVVRLGPAADTPHATPAEGPARFFDAVERPPPGLASILEQLHFIDLEGEPVLDIDFLFVPNDPGQTTLQIRGGGAESRLRGVRIDEWALAAGLREGRLTVEQFTLQDGHNRFQLSGAYDFDKQIAQGEMTSNLPASHWLSLMPIAWRDGIQESGFFFEGAIGCHASFGPAPFSQLLQYTSGTLSVHRAEALGIWVQDANFRFSHTQGDLRLTDVQATIGSPTQQGTIQGAFSYDFDRHAYEGTLDGNVDFHALLPILSEGMAGLVRNAMLTDHPAHASVRFQRTAPEDGAFSMQGFLRATNFLWRGSFVERLDTGLVYSNRTTLLEPFLAERPEGRIEGSIAVNASDKRVDLHLSSSIDAHAAGRGSGPALQRTLDRFRFDGPTTARVDGVVFWGKTGDTLLTATATAYNAGYQALMADRVDFSVIVSNRHVAVHSLHAELFGGSLQGWFTTDPRAPGEPGRNYRLQAEVEDVDFRRLALAFRQEEGRQQRGRLSGQLELEGVLNPAHPEVATGSGSIRIRDGMLLRVRLFGGLSRQLNRFLPGLGVATQTDFMADFHVANRRIYTDGATIEGPIINLTGEGSYGFDRTLDFDVRVRLLRDRSGLGRVIQLVTTPLFWWLEFDLEGTIDDPVWSARTLPRDLLGVQEEASP